MTLSLLLDEHISPRVAVLLRENGLDVLAIQEWHGGAYLSRSDRDVLIAAEPEQRTLVTYDLKTIPKLLEQLLESSREHAGVILVSQKTIPSHDIAALVHALAWLLQEHGHQDLRNGVLFAARSDA